MDRFRRMEIFIAVVEAGQLTRAAQILHVSKSAVSHALADLEKYLELQLFKRSNRSWQLTDAGSIYYKQCKKILSDVQSMEDAARGDRHNLSGKIRLSAPDTFASYTLVPVIAKFMEMHPDIIIEISLTERFVDLHEERMDIAFRTGQINDSSLFTETIGEAATMVCVSPAYLEKYGAPETHLDIKNHRSIEYTRSPKWRLKKENRWYEFTPKSHFLTDSGETMREACIRGQGLAIMPSMLAEFAIKKGRLVQVLKSYECGTMPVSALRLGNNRAPARVKKLLDFIVAELRSRPRDISEFVK